MKQGKISIFLLLAGDRTIGRTSSYNIKKKMKKVFNFNSFLNSLNEAKIQDMTFEDVLKSRGGDQQDSDPQVQFAYNSIKKVFGKSDYLTRFRIAQALKLMGDDQFPTNSKFSNFQINKDMPSKDGVFLTFYIGEKDQNEKMDKISEPLLLAIKPVVDLMEKNPDEVEKFLGVDSVNIPEVKIAKVESQKIKK